MFLFPDALYQIYIQETLLSKAQHQVPGEDTIPCFSTVTKNQFFPFLLLSALPIILERTTNSANVESWLEVTITPMPQMPLSDTVRVMPSNHAKYLELIKIVIPKTGLMSVKSG